MLGAALNEFKKLALNRVRVDLGRGRFGQGPYPRPDQPSVAGRAGTMVLLNPGPTTPLKWYRGHLVRVAASHGQVPESAIPPPRIPGYDDA